MQLVKAVSVFLILGRCVIFPAMGQKILKAQQLETDVGDGHLLWDSLSVDMVVRSDNDPVIGLLLNYSDSSDFHFLTVANRNGQLLVQLGRKQYGHTRIAEQFVKDGQLLAHHNYRLKVYRAPWVDREHWRQWKAELIDLSQGTRIFKESVENILPFFGLGRTGPLIVGPATELRAFNRYPTEPRPEQASLKPAALFGSGMVLQREKPIPVWGTAKPGSRVYVVLANRGDSTLAGPDGSWRVVLPAREAATGLTMQIRCGTATVEFQDIAIGEVWVASGQSNLEMRAWQSDVVQQLDSTWKNGAIRFFMQQQWPSPQPEETAVGKWIKADSPDAWGCSAAALSFAIHLNGQLGIPVGILQAAWGGTGVESWIPVDSLRAIPQASAMLERYNGYLDVQKAGGEVTAEWPWSWDVPGQNHAPAFLYNGMIHPLRSYPVRGVLWYQGESNCHRSSQYQYLLPTFLKSWREAWRDDSLAFIGVQLAGYDGRQSGNQVPGAWPLLRDIQRRVLDDDPRARLVTAFDLGDSLDIHPYRKWELGRRMSLAAVQLVQGGLSAPFSGPDVANVKLEGKTAWVSYKKGTADFGGPDSEITGFEVAGDDRRFHPARATLTADGRIRLTSADVPHIAAVRYGWENYPVRANLKNTAGLGAIPFRTDNWEIADQYPY
ncbi:sialate O-acetylesterase [Parapedobacter defluvii]|uniref:sialate O-acetylesterase n=1 Tax=Parapedobacter defluvii TaxID=2045106 RepID=UPI003341FCF6